MITFNFEAVSGLAPLTATLPNTTSIYHEWPPKNLRVSLPKYQSVATVIPDKSVDDTFTLPAYNEHRLMSTPIHIRNGDFLSVSVMNSLQSTGLSIHWHGFEMTGNLEYDGVVGITQCPISPTDTFTYKWQVDETPGTYWYHTHSGGLGIDAYNAIMGPLIVHPKLQEDEEERSSSSNIEIPFLDPGLYTKDPRAQQKMSFDNLLFYGNERILFFKNGFLHSGTHELLGKMGGLNPPISYNDDKFSVGTYPWHFGTCNGKLREVVPASPGETLKFRLLNAGAMYALRISFDGFQMTVIAADSEPIEHVETDEIILHAAERFDVLLKIPDDAEIGSTSWIRADTLESRKQGYQNGIRSILHIVDGNESESVSSSDAVPDPSIPIETQTDPREQSTYNCYSHIETVEASAGGGCFPVTSLSLKDGGSSHGALAIAKAFTSPTEVHVVDWQFSPSPQFAHFVRIDGGSWYQFAMFSGHSMLLPDYDLETMLHPNGAVLNVEAGVGSIIIWRSKSTMDHPIHLHGRKMEILDQRIIKKSDHCDQIKCNLSEVFSSNEALEALKRIPFGSRALKDTFILPAGGAVATRIFTGDPALWFSHCHMESHRESGMAFILNVGNYQSPATKDWLPSDYPRCNTPFLQSKKQFPSCSCYINDDALMDGSLTIDHKCSRDSLCFHENSPQSSLEFAPHESSGIAIRSQYSIPSWGISLIIVIIVALVSVAIAYKKKLVISYCKSRHNEKFAHRQMTESDGTNSAEDDKMDIQTGVPVEKKECNFGLLLINFQNCFCHEKGERYCLSDNEDILSKASDLITFARNQGAAVIHTPTILQEGDPELIKCGESFFKAGSWNSEMALTKAEGDIVLPSKTYNVLGKELKELLEEKCIEKLFVCGFLLDASVHKTVISLSRYLDEIDVCVVEDCCAASNKKSPVLPSMRFLVNFIGAEEAKQVMLNASAVATTTAKANNGTVLPRPPNRTTISVQVNRTLPLTMDLPGSNQKRRTTTRRHITTVRNRSGGTTTTPQDTRATLLGFVQRLSNPNEEPLPLAEKDFTVPARRTVIDFEVEGFKISGGVEVQQDDSNDINEDSPFIEQFKFLFCSQWVIYRPTCISLLRVGEVCSLAFFTGALFYDCGNNTTATGFGSINSLLFFSVTLWTFTRMYPAINTYFDWKVKLTIISNEHRYWLLPACLARCAVVAISESPWPFLYVLVCYPLSSLAGSWNAMFRIALMLMLNNICYVSIGACLGVVVKRIPAGMITSTIIAQSSLVAAGFYTEVPAFLAWLRYLSPVFWTYRGIVKSAFEWSDTFRCRWGSTLAGVNSCFIEFHTAINNLKDRGINVATFGDDQSTKIWLECLVLVLFYCVMQSFIIALSLLKQHHEDRWEMHFERLAEFKAVHGNCIVPKDYSVNSIGLGSWVYSIRKRKRKLTEEQKERLESLGMKMN